MHLGVYKQDGTFIKRLVIDCVSFCSAYYFHTNSSDLSLGSDYCDFINVWVRFGGGVPIPVSTLKSTQEVRDLSLMVLRIIPGHLGTNAFKSEVLVNDIFNF